MGERLAAPRAGAITIADVPPYEKSTISAQMAEQAAKFTAIAQRDFDVKLDYSAESIASFEEVLDKMYRETHGLRGLIKRNRMTDQRAPLTALHAP